MRWGAGCPLPRGRASAPSRPVLSARSICSPRPPCRTPSSGSTATGSPSSAGSSPASRVSISERCAGPTAVSEHSAWALGAQWLWSVLGTQRRVVTHVCWPWAQGSMGRPALGVSASSGLEGRTIWELFQAAPCQWGWLRVSWRDPLAKKARGYSASLLASSSQMPFITLSPGKPCGRWWRIQGERGKLALPSLKAFQALADEPIRQQP